jgi:hypothetical protein
MEIGRGFLFFCRLVRQRFAMPARPRLSRTHRRVINECELSALLLRQCGACTPGRKVPQRVLQSADGDILS